MNYPPKTTAGRGRTVNVRRESCDVYIGRGSEWGNPLSHKQGTQAETIVATREEAVERYRAHLWQRIKTEGAPIINRLAQLNGQRLGCYCASASCHGDVLVVAAAWAAQENERLVIAELKQTFRL